VRHISFDVSNGFLLNGHPTKFYGGCLHHDNGALGTKAISRAEERRVEILKANGYNAIRTSHNPVSPAFLDACDRLGVLVMDEAFDCWAQGKNTDDYHVWFDEWWERDIASMVLRDRNHPSVVMWSIGNEIPMRKTAAGFNLSHVLSDYVRSLDSPHSGRAVTSAYPGVGDEADKFFAPLEVAGYNYSPQRYESDHVRVPSRIIVGTESFPKDSFQMWDLAWQHDWVMGDFIWTMMDYIGESDIGYESQSGDVDQCAGTESFPWHISFCGDIDNAGHQKPQAYYRKVLWGVTPIEMAVHIPISPDAKESVGGWGWIEERQSWTWGEDAPKGLWPLNISAGKLNVNVYAKGGTLHTKDAACTEVGLSITTTAGKKIDLGTKPVGHATQFTATYTGVDYKAGTITATCTAASSEDAVGAATSYTTAAAVAQLSLEVNRSSIDHSRDDLAFVNVLALDAAGTLVPDAAVSVTFKIDGVGEMAAVGNGDPQVRRCSRCNMCSTYSR
jgi:beta-galactosidase